MAVVVVVVVVVVGEVLSRDRWGVRYEVSG